MPDPNNTPAEDRPIFLVGFMGAGKTTVGRALARQLRWDFFDLDDLIEQRAGKSVQAIFSESGESEFRRLEREGLIKGEWRLTENNRRAKRYVLTARGRARLKDDMRDWEAQVRAISLILKARLADL